MTTSSKLFQSLLEAATQESKNAILKKFEKAQAKELKNDLNDFSHRTVGNVKKILNSRGLEFERIDNDGDNRQFSILFKDTKDNKQNVFDLKAAGFKVKSISKYITILVF